MTSEFTRTAVPQLVTEEQLKQIRRGFWGSSDNVLGNDMIEIDEAYSIVCECIGYEEE